MKKATVLCVGKIKEKYLADGIAEYAKRLSRFCEFSVVELADEPGEAEVRLESDAILRRLRGYVVLLDIGGKELGSPEFAAAIDRAYLSAPKSLSLSAAVAAWTSASARLRTFACRSAK